MVKIRRPPKRRAGKSRWCSLRKIVLVSLTYFGIRMIFRSDINPADEVHLPMSIEDRLRESRGNVPTPKKPHNSLSNLHSPERIQNDIISSAEEPDEDKNPHFTAGDPVAGSAKDQIVLEKQGTGPTNIAYIKDFTRERKTIPIFQSIVERSATDTSKFVASTVKKSSVEPCHFLKDGRRVNNPKCLDPETPLIAYNSAWFTRTWCGQEINSGQVVQIDGQCSDEVVHLFSTDVPPVSGQGMKPVIIKYKQDSNLDSNNLQNIECSIPCKQETGVVASNDRYIDGQKWQITYSANSQYSPPIEHLEYRKEHYYSTPSFKSSVPQTSFDWSKYDLRASVPVDWATAKNSGVYLVNENCSSQSRRHKYLAAMSAVISVDKYGKCSHNIDIPPGMTLDTLEGRIEIMKQYRIVLAFDASDSKDHISSLIWEALISGAVPVIVGAENMQSHLPKGSFIWSGSYSNWDELAKYVNEIMNDKTLWESYHTWRNDEDIIAAFEARYNFAHTESACRLCQWAYSKMYGLGWDSLNQKVTETKLKRSLCATSSSKGLISGPFKEVWVVREAHDDISWVVRETNDGIVVNEDGTTSNECGSKKSDIKIESAAFKVHRVVTLHDGVIDITIKEFDRFESNGKIILRLHFPGFNNSDGAHFKNTHSLVSTTWMKTVSSASMQDDFAKVTVLSDWITNISSTKEGIVEIVVEDPNDSMSGGENSFKRIRVIPEDVDVKNDKMTEFFPSPFCKQMIKDFVDPLELFIAS